MIEGRIVTNEQAEQLQGVFIDHDTFFNFVQDINGIYFLFLDNVYLNIHIVKILKN